MSGNGGEGRTIWWAKDCAWWRRERVVALLEDLGLVGPALLDWLSCEAKAQNDGGRVKAGVRTAARALASDPDTIRNALTHAVTLGALHELEEEDGLFTCRISGWEADNGRGGTALRVARHRAKTDEEVTDGNGEKRSVTAVTHRAEKSREQKDSPPDPLTGEFDEWLAFHEQLTGTRPPREGTKARDHILSMFRARREEGHSADDLKQAVTGAFNDEFRRENGHFGHESVLRPKKVHDLIERGRRGTVTPIRKRFDGERSPERFRDGF